MIHHTITTLTSQSTHEVVQDFSKLFSTLPQEKHLYWLSNPTLWITDEGNYISARVLESGEPRTDLGKEATQNFKIGVINLKGVDRRQQGIQSRAVN